MADPDDDHGDNGGGDADTYLEYVREQTLDQIEKDKIVGRMRARSKRAKAAGIDLDADALVHKLAKLDPDTRHARMQNVQKQASWRGLTVFTPGVDPKAEQAGLWPEPSPDIKQGHLDAAIYADGNNSRRAGGSRHDNPQMAGSRDFQTWDKGWLDCEEDMKAQGGGTPASTERRPRAAKGNGAAATDAPAAELPAAKPKRGKKGAAEAAAAD